MTVTPKRFRSKDDPTTAIFHACHAPAQFDLGAVYDAVHRSTDAATQTERYRAALQRNPILAGLLEAIRNDPELAEAVRAVRARPEIQALERLGVANASYLHDAYFKTVLDGNIMAHWAPPSLILSCRANPGITFFDSLKTYTLVFTSSVFTALIFSKLRFKTLFLTVFTHVIVFVNILEAVFTDAIHGQLNNAFLGMVLCLRIPWLRPVRVDDRGHMLSPYSQAWIDLYNSWNLCFIYGSVQHRYSPAIFSKIVATMYAQAEFGSRYWLYSRTYTLAFAIYQFRTQSAFYSTQSCILPELVKLWGKHNASAAWRHLRG
jgi:hypothetical protein